MSSAAQKHNALQSLAPINAITLAIGLRNTRSAGAARAWLSAFGAKLRSIQAAPVLARTFTAATVAICLSASTGRADTAPASAAVLKELKPYAAAIGNRNRLAIHDDPAPAPVMAFTDRNGDAVALSDYKGKIVLVNFWATFCAPCLEEMPALDALQKKLGGDDFRVVAINLDPTGVKRPLAWLEKHKIDTLDFYHDKSWETAKASGSVGLPTTMLIDRSGREIGRLVGAAEWDSRGAVEAMQLLISDAPAGG